MSDPCSPPHSPTGPEVEAQLRNLGLGYRARFVSASARAILEERGGLPWLQQLRKAPYEEAHKALCTLPGVGTKVRPRVEGKEGSRKKLLSLFMQRIAEEETRQSESWVWAWLLEAEWEGERIPADVLLENM